MGFKDKVVIVTGASSGIGASIAVKFSESGANLVLVARNETKLKEVAKECQRFGSKSIITIADVSKNADIESVIKTTVSQYGRIDVLVNNAGIFKAAGIFDDNAMDVYDRIMSTNLRSAVYLTYLAAPHLVKAGGNIINISSVAAVDATSPEYFAYCTSKAGMDHFTRCMAVDLGRKGVRVNTVNPGPVRTPIFEVFDEAALSAKTILGRVSEPDEVADLVLFLANDKAKGITGSTYMIDNGFLLSKK